MAKKVKAKNIRVKGLGEKSAKYTAPTGEKRFTQINNGQEIKIPCPKYKPDENGVKLKNVGGNYIYLTGNTILNSSRPLLDEISDEQKESLFNTRYDDSKVDIKSEDWLDRESDLLDLNRPAPKPIKRMKAERKTPISLVIHHKKTKRVKRDNHTGIIEGVKPYFNDKAFKIFLKCKQVKNFREAHKLASNKALCEAFLARLSR